MNNTGRNKESGYLVALLLVVGLAAFSNSMRELADIHRFTLDTSRLIARYVAPAENPQIPQVPQVVIAKLNSCKSRQAVPAVEIQWLEDVEGITEPGVQATVPAPPAKAERVARRVRGNISGPTEFQLAKVDKLRKFDFPSVPFEFNSKQFEFKVLSDNNGESDAMLPLTMLKAKNRSKHNLLRLNTRDREMILKTLNRSINLRTAS
jgi:hypothetical protein